MGLSAWWSDVCSSDLAQPAARRGLALAAYETLAQRRGVRIGQAAALVVDHHPRLAAGEGERRRDTLAFGTIDGGILDQIAPRNEHRFLIDGQHDAADARADHPGGVSGRHPNGEACGR